MILIKRSTTFTYIFKYFFFLKRSELDTYQKNNQSQVLEFWLLEGTESTGFIIESLL